MSKTLLARRFAFSVAAVAAVALAGCRMFMPVPSDLDYSSVQLSEQGSYRVSYASDPAPAPVSKLHTWTITVQTPDGKPVDGAEIKVDGDMPQHGHGLPTKPVVTESLGNGAYKVEGMKFQMGGWWQIYLDIESQGKRDKATFNLKL